MSEKRRLKLMPEVLPAPTLVQPGTNVRGRTLSHMQRMLATAMTAAATTTATTTTTASATPTATAPDIGYGVVDPMPAPARCAGVAAAAKAKAVYVSDAKGLALVLTVSLPATSQLGAKFSSRPASAWGSVVLSASIAGGITATIRVRPTTTSIGVSIPVDCSAGPGTLSASISSLPTAPKAGDTAVVNLNDY
ncbi:MAG TPA: hypothetical protein VF316_09950 [Polyangiaceae bacterium]